MGKLRSVAARLGLIKQTEEPSKEASVPPKPSPTPEPPKLKEMVQPEPEPPPKPAPKPHPVLVNAALINFDGSAPLTERGLRRLLLFPDKHRIYLKSRGQVRQFHGGEVLDPIPDDLEIFTRE